VAQPASHFMKKHRCPLWRLSLALILKMLVVGGVCAESPDQPTPRLEAASWMSLEDWYGMHSADLTRAKSAPIEVLFLGDSITEGWELGGSKEWRECFFPLNAANFGIRGDTTQHVLWRITTGGALKGVTPRVAVLMIGTNNIGDPSAAPELIARGIEAIIERLHQQSPTTKVILLDIFPRGNPEDPARIKVMEVNRLIETYAKTNTKVTHLRIWDEFLSADGTIPPEIMPDRLHLTPQGYAIWAKAMLPTLQALLLKP
jgi:lysophospholipase L1-like esterase